MEDQEVFRIMGYVDQIAGDRIEVITTEQEGTPKRLSMPYHLFSEAGILGKDMHFCFITYRKEDGQLYSMVVPDDEHDERRTDNQIPLHLQELGEIEAAQRRLLGFTY